MTMTERMLTTTRGGLNRSVCRGEARLIGLVASRGRDGPINGVGIRVGASNNMIHGYGRSLRRVLLPTILVLTRRRLRSVISHRQSIVFS